MKRLYRYLLLIGKQNETILKEIEDALEEGPKYYDDETYTDQTIKMIVEEIIREKALKLLDEEVPHGIYVEVQKLKKGKTMENEPIFNIEATIFCERDSHKGIIIRKKRKQTKTNWNICEKRARKKFR